MSNLNTITAELDEAWQRLRQRWEETKAMWNDPVRWQFEREFWQPLESQVPIILKEMERLAQVIAQARRNVR
ncbi:MAG: hypothetical protein H5T64_08235 [Chloroflexi bacterium]|nr:hypothetical protein [Chloroflexota bacterium]